MSTALSCSLNNKCSSLCRFPDVGAEERGKLLATHTAAALSKSSPPRSSYPSVENTGGAVARPHPGGRLPPTDEGFPKRLSRKTVVAFPQKVLPPPQAGGSDSEAQRHKVTSTSSSSSSSSSSAHVISWSPSLSTSLSLLLSFFVPLFSAPTPLPAPCSPPFP